MTVPSTARTGAPTAARPSSSSSSEAAQPRRRTSTRAWSNWARSTGECGVRRSRLPGGSGSAPIGVEHLAQRRAVGGHVDPDPVRRADQVLAVDLVDLSPPGRPAAPRGSPSRGSAATGAPSSGGRAPRGRAARWAARRAARTARPGRNAPARSRCTSLLRSSACRSREVVDFASPSSVDQRGERARRPRLDDHAEKCACPLDGLASRLLWRGHGSPSQSFTLWNRCSVNCRYCDARRPLASRGEEPTHVPQCHAPLRNPQRGCASHTRRGVAQAGLRDRRGVRIGPRVGTVPPGGAEGRGQRRPLRPRLPAGAGGEGAPLVRRAGPQPREHRAHRRRRDGVRRRVRPALRARRRGAPRRQDGRLPQLRPPRAEFLRDGFGGRHRLRARGHAARLPPPRHDLRAADAHRQDLHGQRRLGRERAGHAAG